MNWFLPLVKAMTCTQACRRVLREEYSTKLGWKMTDEEWEIMATMAKLPGDPIVQHRTKQMWVMWKIAVALYGVAAVLNNIVSYATGSEPFGNMFIYVTNWTLILEAIFLVCSGFFSMKFLKHNEETSDFGDAKRQHWTVVCLWILQHIVFVSATGVTILYWAMVYDGGKVPPQLMDHVVNIAVLLPDYFFSQLPFRLLHGWLPIAYAIMYIIFSIIAYVAGVPTDSSYIYSALDWDDIPSTIVTCVGVIFILLLLHFVLYGASMVTLSMKAKKKKNEPEVEITYASVV